MSKGSDLTLSVLVLPSGEAGERFSETLNVWYRTGLLLPAVWIRPEDVHVGEGQAPDIQGVLRIGSEVTEGDLFTFLGQRRLALVRVVLVQLLDKPGSYDGQQIQRAMDVQYWVRESVPAPRISADGTEIDGTEVRTINLVTGVTGLAAMPPEIVPRGWDIAAVTSPEDRPDPGRANAFVRADINLEGVALLSTAVVANLIPGASAGPFDDINEDASVVLGKALVIRSTARALVGEAIVQDLACTTLADARGPQSLGVSDPERFAVGDRDVIVDEVLEWLDLVDEGVAAPSAMDIVPDSARVEMSIKTGLSVLVRFAVGALGVMITGLWRLLVRRTESAATRAIVGENAGVELVLVPRVGSGLGDDLAQIEQADIELCRSALLAATRRPARTATKELWVSLRDIAHASVDGGSVPAGAPSRFDGSKPVLLRQIGDVAPAPDDVFVLESSVDRALDAMEVAACSPTEAREAEQRIAEALSAARDAVAEANASLAAARTAPQDEGGDNKTDVSTAKSALAAAEARLRDLTTVEQDFRQWLERRRGSLLWRFRERNSARLTRSSRAESQAERAATQPSGLETNALDKLRRRFLWQSWAVVAIAVCIGVGLYYTGDSRNANLAKELGLVAGGAVIAVGVVIVLWYQRILALLHKYEQAAERRARATAEFEKHHGDRRRFEDIERGTELWCDVIGWSLHTPWLDQKPTGDTTNVQEVLASLPSAVQLGEPALDERDVAVASRAAASEVTTAGWRARAYDRLVALFSELPSDAAEVETIAAIERLDAPHGREDLRLFRDQLCAGQLQRVAGDLFTGEIEGFLRRERLALSTLSVRPLGTSPDSELLEKDTDFLARALVPASPFSQETWSEQARVQGAHQDVVTRAWARQGPAGMAAHGVLVKPVDEADLENSRLIDVVVRSDVSAWLDLDRLRLFGRAPSESQDTWTSGPDDSVFS